MLDRKQKEKRKRKAKEQKSQETSLKDEEVQQSKIDPEDMPPRRQLDLFHFYKKKYHEPDAQSHLGHTTECVEPGAGMQVSSSSSSSASIDSEVDKAMNDNSSSSVDSVSLRNTLDKTVADNDNGEHASIGSNLNSRYSQRSANKPDTYTSLNTGLHTLANRTITTNAVIQKNSPYNSLPTSPNIDAAMITSTDQGTTLSQEKSYTSNTTSIMPFSSTLHPVDLEALAKCAAPSSLSISLPFPVPQNSQFPLPSDESPSRSPPKSPSYSTNTPIHHHSHPLIVHDRKARENNVTPGSMDENKAISMDLEVGKCMDKMESQDVNESLNPREAFLHAISAPHYNTAIESLLSPISVLASEDGQILERTKSEHGSEKGSRRCDSLNEEASESIRTTSQNVNANELGIGNVSSKNRSIPVPDTFLEIAGGDNAIFIDLTDSPKRGPLTYLSTFLRNEHEHKTYAQRNLFSNQASTDGARYTTSATSHTISMTSPTPGSQEKPIELLSPVKSAAKSQSPPFFQSSSGPSLRESKRQSSEIHPFFQRTAKAAPLSVIDMTRNVGRDAVLSMNLPDSNTAGSAKARVRVEKGKRNKDKTGYEAHDNPKGDEDADVIFSHTTSEKKTRFRYLSSRSPNSMFGSNGSGVTNATGQSSSLRSVPSRAQTREAPWPNSETQHILPSQKSNAEKRCVFPKRRRIGGYEGAEEQGILAERLGSNRNQNAPPGPDLQVAQSRLRRMGDSTIPNAIESIPEEHRRHPGIARVISVIKKTEEKGGNKEAEGETEVPFDHSMWTTKWKPRRAAEVLGNESHAVYLREWLKALSIRDRERALSCTEENRKGDGKEDTQSQKKKREKKSGETRGTKRPTVIRSITRKKRRRVGSSEDEDEDTSWIVDDGEEEAESDKNVDGDEDDWEPDERKSPGENGDTSKDLEREFSQRLTNTILLAGRPGTGKTSTVYACAAELGWEIFEVYPGIGKRTGMNIAALIGDVGKNHIVGKGIRQSIILLEEVDILFKEDTNFWTSVLNIISTSHRPVILTCNGKLISENEFIYEKKNEDIEFRLIDVSLVPQRDLPLQKCLNFEACPCGLALSFLQVVCNAEGYDVTRTCVEEEYSLMGGDEPEWPPSIAFPSEALPSADLRSTLNRLQMGLKFPVSQEEYFETFIEWEAGEYTLKHCEMYAESASYIDAHLGRIEQLQKPGFETQGDDEIGYTMLTNPEEYPSMGVQKNDSSHYYSMACDALACCRHVVKVPSRSKSQVSQTQAGHRWLIQTRRLLARQAATFLDELISLPGPLLPRQEAILEYIPAIRWLVALDDKDDPIHSATAIAVLPRRRWRHVRYLDLSQEALRAVREYYDMFFPR